MVRKLNLSIGVTVLEESVLLNRLGDFLQPSFTELNDE